MRRPWIDNSIVDGGLHLCAGTDRHFAYHFFGDLFCCIAAGRGNHATARHYVSRCRLQLPLPLHRIAGVVSDFQRRPFVLASRHDMYLTMRETLTGTTAGVYLGQVPTP